MAGLAELLLGKQNPFSQYVAENRNAVHNAFSGFGRGTDIGSGLGYAAQGAAYGTEKDDAYATQQKAEQERLNGINQTAAWLKQNYPQFSNLPPDQGFALASKFVGAGSTAQNDPASVQEYNFYANQALTSGEKPMSYIDWRKGSNQTVRAGLGQPISLRNKKTGEYAPFQPMSDGTIINTLTGQPGNEAEWSYDPTQIARDKAEGSASGTKFGTETTTAALDLPTVIDRGTQAISLIDQLLPEVRDPQTGKMIQNQGFNEQFGTVFGVPVGQMTPAMPNTPKADFQSNLDQVKAQGFLQGIEQMKGTGAISEAEGSKATDAIINARTSTTKEGFVRNMTIAKEIIAKGIERAKAKASQSAYSIPYSGGADPVAAADALLGSGKY